MATIAQQKPRWKRSAGVAGYVFFLVFVLAAAMFCGWVAKSRVLTQIIKSQFGFGISPAETFKSHQVTMLVLGCDEDRQYVSYHESRVINGRARSDMMLLTKLDFDKKTITGISIPRDMKCTLDGVSHKINAFHAIGGPDLAKRAVETLLGVPVDKVIVLNYDAFQELVSMVGGIEVDVDKDLDYDDNAGHLHIHIKKGHQHLDGKNAMGFVRFRHADDDFHRQARQKQFLVAFKSAALSHWSNLPAITQQAVQVLGGSMDDEQVAALAIFARSVSPQNIRMGVVPAINPDANPMEVDRRGLRRALVQYGFTTDLERITSRR